MPLQYVMISDWALTQPIPCSNTFLSNQDKVLLGKSQLPQKRTAEKHNESTVTTKNLDNRNLCCGYMSYNWCSKRRLSWDLSQNQHQLSPHTTAIWIKIHYDLNLNNFSTLSTTGLKGAQKINSSIWSGNIIKTHIPKSPRQDYSKGQNSSECSP